jgi:hypothetical protein
VDAHTQPLNAAKTEKFPSNFAETTLAGTTPNLFHQFLQTGGLDGKAYNVHTRKTHAETEYNHLFASVGYLTNSRRQKRVQVERHPHQRTTDLTHREKAASFFLGLFQNQSHKRNKPVTVAWNHRLDVHDFTFSTKVLTQLSNEAVRSAKSFCSKSEERMCVKGFNGEAGVMVAALGVPGSSKSSS